MGNVIAGTYEIERQIGAGGGGTVYLARHLRLGKAVVLKADKRTLQAKPEALRREVDALKDLSHTYIPQVYDFVAEAGMVYTVMDYIEGESLDKPLGRGQRFDQAQVIGWAKQLLEALVYLHSRPPYGILHGDIKPANVMVTPQGDIRLIDFNIALALGEEGAVQVGFSRGYASPEHYGMDYRVKNVDPVSAETQMPGGAETVLPGESSQSAAQRPVRLDVRSDIYSLGATLYHLLSGVKPPQDAMEVESLTQSQVSRAVAGVIAKAMAPNPDARYQSAQEMLDALRHLHRDDPRSKGLKRTGITTAAVLAGVFLLGAGLSFTGLRQIAAAQTGIAQEAMLAEQAVSCVRDAETAYQEGDVPQAVRLSIQALDAPRPYGAQAQRVLTDALGVYDLSDGLKVHSRVELPSKPLKLALSPGGKSLAVLTAGQVTAFDCETGQSLVTLPARPTALCDLAFLGEEVLLYAGEKGLSAYDLTAGQPLWQGEAVTRIAVSDDGSRAVGVLDQAERALVYSLEEGALVKELSFQGNRQSIPADGGILADPEDALLALNADGSLLAVSFEGGGLCLYDVASEEKYTILDHSDYYHFEGGFFQHYFAFSAWSEAGCIFLIYDTATMSQNGGFQAQVPFRVQADETGIYVASGNLLVRIDPLTGEQQELAYAGADISAYARSREGYVLLATAEGEYDLFGSEAQLVFRGERRSGCEFLTTAGPWVALSSREDPGVQVLKLETHPETQLFTCPSSTVSYAEARVSADLSRVMLFQYQTFTLFTREGEELCRVDIPDAMEVYDQQFRRDEAGDRLEVSYMDGRTIAYSARDGSLLWERQDPAPKGDLSETFETRRWRFEASPHSAPQVYDKETGQLYRELEPDSYLTYVTEVGDYLVTQYLSAKEEHYGLLLDQNCDVLAYLPNLCDVVGDTLVFDDGFGNLRTSRIYSTQELVDLGKYMLREEK